MPALDLLVLGGTCLDRGCNPPKRLVHEASTAVAAGADAERIAETTHVHPALSEVVQGSFRDAEGMELTSI
jgi:pyruvate/2-oxoglutarate dehydrogenase complex dihydrolipoamide dehydrogenase (E3) component